jgi:phosphohistidine phosphatase
MRIFIVRHAKAASGSPDELRELTPEGHEQARRLAQELAGARPDAVLSSPLLRARQTAEAIAEASGVEVRVDERLAPGADAASLVQAASEAGETVVTVGHQPDCSEIAEALTGRDPGFHPAGYLEVEVEVEADRRS